MPYFWKTNTNGTEQSPEIDPQKYTQLKFYMYTPLSSDQGAKLYGDISDKWGWIISIYICISIWKGWDNKKTSYCQNSEGENDKYSTGEF